MDQIYEEIEAIEAIFCRENEFCLHSKDTSYVEFAVTTSPVASPDLKITVVFNLSALSYPNQPPSVSVRCSSLTRMECDRVKTFLINTAESCCGAPMILNLLTALGESKDIRGTPQTTLTLEKDTSKGPMTCVLHLDHMRNKTRYLKTIKSWCDELALFGRIIFCMQWIFIILQGNEENIKMYIQRNRTQCVDVDSSGNPCKERLLSVLYQGSQDKKFMDFEIHQVENTAELKSWMANCSSLDLFEDVIVPVISRR